MAKRYDFKDLGDFYNYLISNKRVMIRISSTFLENYPGLIQEVSILSENSGKNLSVVNEYRVDYALDVDGDLSVVELYDFNSLEELISFIGLNFNINLNDLNLRKRFDDKLISDYNYNELTSKRLRDIWERFKRDWESGKLMLKGKTPKERHSCGF